METISLGGELMSCEIETDVFQIGAVTMQVVDNSRLRGRLLDMNYSLILSTKLKWQSKSTTGSNVKI